MIIPWEAVAAALVAAVLHAAWNAALKGGDDRLLDATLLFAVGGVIGLGVTLVTPPINSAAIVWLIAPALLHIPYTYFLALAYERGDLSHVYTIARGLPPLIVVALAAVAVGEIPTLAAVVGIALISSGILAVGFSPGANREATTYAAIVAVAIALYTVCDGIGVRLSGSPIAYTGWAFVAVSIVTLTMASVLRRGRIVAYTKRNWRRAVLGGTLSFVSYGLVLWAMTRAPIAAISALRETSVVFAALIGVVFFAEDAAHRRLAGAAIVAVGAMVLKLA